MSSSLSSTWHRWQAWTTTRWRMALTNKTDRPSNSRSKIQRLVTEIRFLTFATSLRSWLVSLDNPRLRLQVILAAAMRITCESQESAALWSIMSSSRRASRDNREPVEPPLLTLRNRVASTITIARTSLFISAILRELLIQPKKSRACNLWQASLHLFAGLVMETLSLRSMLASSVSCLPSKLTLASHS